jgi:hypothetical protein
MDRTLWFGMTKRVPRGRTGMTRQHGEWEADDSDGWAPVRRRDFHVACIFNVLSGSVANVLWAEEQRLTKSGVWDVTPCSPCV